METATDAAERLSGTSLMRHAVRELDQSVTAHNSKREATLLRRTQADQQQALVRDQLKRLSEDARFAIAKGRDDLAAQTIARQIDCERELERLDGVAAEARNEAASLADGIAEISRRKTRLQAELRTIDSAQAKMDSSAANAKAERKVRQAEGTFDRVKTARGDTLSIVVAAQSAESAEIDAMRKSDVVAERLAALKSDSTRSGTKSNKKGR